MEDNIYSRRMHKGDQDRGKVVSQRRTDFQKCQLHFSIRRVYNRVWKRNSCNDICAQLRYDSREQLRFCFRLIESWPS